MACRYWHNLSMLRSLQLTKEGHMRNPIKRYTNWARPKQHKSSSKWLDIWECHHDYKHKEIIQHEQCKYLMLANCTQPVVTLSLWEIHKIHRFWGTMLYMLQLHKRSKTRNWQQTRIANTFFVLRRRLDDTLCYSIFHHSSYLSMLTTYYQK